MTTAEDQAVKDIVELNHDVVRLTQTVEELKQEISDLLAAWKAATVVVGFVKLLGSVALAVTAITLWFKGLK
jgi:hypothetical protein